MDARPTRSSVASRLALELREPVRLTVELGRPRPERITWAAESDRRGSLVVKARRGDHADEKTRWCAEHLPLLSARGYPVPEIIWHDSLGDEWYAVVQGRLPGAPLESLDPPLLDALLQLVELQADAGLDAGVCDFAAYQALVLFDGWDHVLRDAEGASREAERICARLRSWLEPVWGHRLQARDFANNDLNLTNVLASGATITGVVDWDEFGLNSRAADLVALAFDRERLAAGSPGDSAVADRLLERSTEIAGEEGFRCLVSYRAIALLAAVARRRAENALREWSWAAGRVLARVGA